MNWREEQQEERDRKREKRKKDRKKEREIPTTLMWVYDKIRTYEILKRSRVVVLTEAVVSWTTLNPACYGMLVCYVTLRYVTLRDVTLRYVTLRYVMLLTLFFHSLGGDRLNWMQDATGGLRGCCRPTLNSTPVKETPERLKFQIC